MIPDRFSSQQQHATRPIDADDSLLSGASDAFGIGSALAPPRETCQEPRHDPLMGANLDGVKIVRLIAEGGMGRVYEGWQEQPGRPVAVKVMRAGIASGSLLKRFEHETRILGRLRRPGMRTGGGHRPVSRRRSDPRCPAEFFRLAPKARPPASG